MYVPIANLENNVICNDKDVKRWTSKFCKTIFHKQTLKHFKFVLLHSLSNYITYIQIPHVYMLTAMHISRFLRLYGVHFLMYLVSSLNHFFFSILVFIHLLDMQTLFGRNRSGMISKYFNESLFLEWIIINPIFH